MVDTVDGGVQIELEVSESGVQTTTAAAALAVASQTDDDMAVLAGRVEMGHARDRRVEIALDVGVQTELPSDNDSLHVRSSPILVAKGVQVVDAERPGVSGPPRPASRHAEAQTEAWLVALEGVTVGVQTDSRTTVEAATVHDGIVLPGSAGPIDRGVQTELLRDMSPTWSTRVTAATQTDEVVKGTETQGDLLRSALKYNERHQFRSLGKKVHRWRLRATKKRRRPPQGSPCLLVIEGPRSKRAAGVMYRGIV
ncbi:hypothetical protein FOZ62_014065 [Perkinsus olseni]|uniref:Uncharacterized protein n=1 Tax=Perkinsus olseni TaxID=32597 RepID=A0A7J6QWA2_PEROL|nr:hypothetical protein FOZ62_014065 [Perkinsus olseni]